MRYLVAMVFAAGGALAATLFVSSPVASLLVRQMTFDNPDDVATLHSLAFMAVNLAGLLGGWAVGWLVSGMLASGGKPSS